MTCTTSYAPTEIGWTMIIEEKKVGFSEILNQGIETAIAAWQFGRLIWEYKKQKMKV